MELAVRPDDLTAAAVALRGVAADLDAARGRFRAAVAREAPLLGAGMAPAAEQALAAAATAAGALRGDCLTAARGLDAIADAYVTTDARALRVPR
jgi:hypothetical protein